MPIPFDYQSAAPEQIAAHILTLHKQAYFRALTYYTNKGNDAMVAKLEQAYKLSKILKLQKEYDERYGHAS